MTGDTSVASSGVVGAVKAPVREPAIVAGSLGSGRLTSILLENAPGVTPGEIAIKLADLDFSNRSEGEELSLEEAYRALLFASTRPADLEKAAGVEGKPLSGAIQEQVISEIAGVAAAEKEISQRDVGGIIAGVLAGRG